MFRIAEKNALVALVFFFKISQSEGDWNFRIIFHYGPQVTVVPVTCMKYDVVP